MNRKLAIIALLLYFAPLAYAQGNCSNFAAGVCPANVPSGMSSFFFISPTAGADTNAGTSESAPWKHLPGMTNCASVCNSTTPAAGEGFIVEGGTTFDTANASSSYYTGSPKTGPAGDTAPIYWHWSGNVPTTCSWTWWPDTDTPPSNTAGCIYIGFDPGWYTGASWTRPTINLDNPLSTSLVASCSYDNSSQFDGIRVGSFTGWPNYIVDGVIIDGFNFEGACTASTYNTQYIEASSQYFAVTNSYFHGWTEVQFSGTYAFGSFPASPTTGELIVATGITSGSSPCTSGSVNPGVAVWTGSQWNCFTDHDQIPMIDDVTTSGGPVSNGASYAVAAWDVFDGSDSYCTGINACSGQASNIVYDFSHNVVRYMSNGLNEPSNVAHVHDNLFEYMYESYDGSAHGGVIEQNGNDLAQPMEIYNNIFRHTDIGITLNLDLTDVSPLYYFNNVMYDIGNGVNCLNVASANSDVSEEFYMTNDTIDSNVNSCALRLTPGGSPAQFKGTLNIQNDHMIATGQTTMAGWVGTLQSGQTLNDAGNEIFQTEAVANGSGQGYTTSNNYQPGYATGATVHAGGNLSTSCSTYSTDSALCNGSTGGVTNTAGAGVVPTLYIASPPARGSTWDAGAYEFSGVGPTVPVVSAGPWYADLDELLFGVRLR